MGVPAHIRRAVKLLHRPSKAYISIAGLSDLFILITRGVKQGCPSAMILFILCMDPIIRWIDSVLDPYDGLLGAYCDDLGIVVNNVPLFWPRLSKMFHIVSRITSLKLNTNKTQILACDPSSLHVLTGLLSQYPDLNSAVSLAIKYLGVWIGPNAEHGQWKLSDCL